jgi:hypothetical protein
MSQDSNNKPKRSYAKPSSKKLTSDERVGKAITGTGRVALGAALGTITVAGHFLRMPKNEQKEGLRLAVREFGEGTKALRESFCGESED